MNNAPCRDCVSREVGCHADARDTRRIQTDGKRCWKTATRLAWRKRAESAVVSAGKNFRKRCKKEVNNAVDGSGQANAA